jgi:DNA-binding PadR family transcriptional regulator
MDVTGAAAGSFLDLRRELRRGLLAKVLRMAAAAHDELGGEGHFDARGGRRRGMRGEFPFGGFGGRGFGGRGFGGGKKRKRFRHADVRAAVLVLLNEEPAHGYQLIQEIEERSGGVWQPSPGSVYPVLQQLEDEGLVRIDQSDGRKVASLTEAGRTYVEDNRAELEAAWNAVTNDVDDRVLEIRKFFDIYKQIAIAGKQLAHVGTESQLAEARKVLTDTRRRLYLILAEDSAGDEQDAEDADRI